MAGVPQGRVWVSLPIGHPYLNVERAVTVRKIRAKSVLLTFLSKATEGMFGRRRKKRLIDPSWCARWIVRRNRQSCSNHPL
jgi:hypothetical protein